MAALGLYVIWSGIGMNFGSMAIPGPAIFPLAVGTLLAIVGIAILFGFGLSREDQVEVDLPGRETVVTVLALAFAVFAFKRMGVAVTFTVFLAILYRAYSGRAWWRAALFGAAGCAIAWGAFAHLLGVSLPWPAW